MANITETDFDRLNQAAKMIETDAAQAFQTVSRTFGKDIALAQLILFLRLKLNPEERWPAPENIEDKIKEILKQEGILTST